MKWSIGSKIGASFAIALMVLIASGAVSYSTTSNLIESADWVARTHSVLAKLDEVLELMKDAETGQRGYVITGEDRYLIPYQGSRDAVSRKMAELRSVTSDSPYIQQHLALLDSQIATKFDELQLVIDTRRARGFGPAAQEVLTDRGRTAMDAVRRLMGELATAEDDLLARRSTTERQLADRAKQAIVVGNVFALVLFALVASFLTRNIAGPLRDALRRCQRDRGRRSQREPGCEWTAGRGRNALRKLHANDRIASENGPRHRGDCLG